MESERPHRTTSTNSSTSELFICFTSRLSSSSSMKLSSKSILSPGRTREPTQISLSSSLSRRLRSNGSMKGGQASPMFPTGGKKRGCAFENPEPSSPKVTCIGQVRVKTKKQGKKLRTRSKRRGEVSFRRGEQQTAGSNASHQELNIQNSNPNGQFSSHQILQHQQQEGLPHRNQKWVHLPLTICEALRAFGAEFNCFLPCRSSCTTSEREKEEKAARSDGTESGNGSSCGAVFARWLVALQEGEGKGREIELVVGEEERVTERSGSLRRREIFEGIEIKEEEERNEVVEEEEEEEEARVSVCVPPKNALLLMRCRSDPVKMAALANRFWESPVRKDEDVVEDDEEEDDEDEEQEDLEVGNEERQREVEEEDGICEKWVMEEEEEDVQENPERSPEVLNEVLQEHPQEQEEEEEREEEEEEEEETVLVNGSSPEVFLDPENSEMEQNVPKLIQENEDSQESEPQAEPEEEIEEEEDDDDKGARFSTSLASVQSEQDSHSQEEEEEETKAEALEEEEEEEEEKAAAAAASELAVEKETAERAWEDEEKVTCERSKPEYPKQETGRESKIRESQQQGQVSVLPDCLLLMMCEPKLSMEVSKETWVCSTDFVRWVPERPPVNKTNGGDELKKRVSTDSKPAHPAPQVLQPPRSSCSYPAAPGAAGAASMASMIEQKLVGAKGYEPFVLKRCKSEPMRSASKLAPDACFWKNRKLEPHRPATLGVGAAGVGC